MKKDINYTIQAKIMITDQDVFISFVTNRLVWVIINRNVFWCLKSLEFIKPDDQ